MIGLVKENKSCNFDYQGIRGEIIKDTDNIKAEGSGVVKFHSGEIIRYYILKQMIHFEGFLSSEIKSFLYDEIMDQYQEN